METHFFHPTVFLQARVTTPLLFHRHLWTPVKWVCLFCHDGSIQKLLECNRGIQQFRSIFNPRNALSLRRRSINVSAYQMLYCVTLKPRHAGLVHFHLCLQDDGVDLCLAEVISLMNEGSQVTWLNCYGCCCCCCRGSFATLVLCFSGPYAHWLPCWYITHTHTHTLSMPSPISPYS